MSNFFCTPDKSVHDVSDLQTSDHNSALLKELLEVWDFDRSVFVFGV